MTPDVALAAALQAGLQLWREGDAIRYRGPQGALTPELRAAFAEQRAQILALIPPGVRLLAPPLTVLRAYLEERIQPGTSAHIRQSCLRFDGPADPAALWQVLQTLCARHEALRSSFFELAGQPVQAIATEAPDVPVLHDGGTETHLAPVARVDAMTPFDVARAPLLRANLTGGREGHTVILTLHQCIADAAATLVIWRELAALYEAARRGEAAELPPVQNTYSQFAEWYAAWQEDDDRRTQLTWWRNALAGADPDLDLPRPERLSGSEMPAAGAGYTATMTEASRAALAALAARTGATPFMLGLSALAALLHRLCGQTDLSVGVPVANRAQPEFREVVGYLSNLVVLRLDLSGDPSFVELAERVRQAALAAYARQELPFESVVEALAPARAAARNPLFQVMFNLVDTAPAGPSQPEPEFLPVVGNWQSDVDLAVSVQPRADEVSAQISYSEDLWSQADARRFVGQLERLLQNAATTPNRPISELSLTGEAAWAAQAAAGRPNHDGDWIQDLLAAQADWLGDRVAIEEDAGLFTWTQLRERAQAVAAALHDAGVGPGCIVVDGLPAGMDQLSVLWGVLLSGATPASLAPERLPDTTWRGWPFRPDLVIGPDLQDGRSNGVHPPRLAVAELLSGRCPRLTERPPAELPAGAAVLLDFGGDMRALSHSAWVALLHDIRSAIPLTADNAVLISGGPGADCFCWEMLWPLLSGARVVCCPPDAGGLGPLARRAGVTALRTTPSRYAGRPVDLTPLRYLLLSGGSIGPLLRAQLQKERGGRVFEFRSISAAPGTLLWRPAEAADGRLSGFRVLGQPISVVDRSGRLAPAGAWGLLAATPAEESGGAPQVSTGETVYLDADGGLHVRDDAASGGWLDGVWVDYRAVEAEMLRLPEVRDVAAFLRETAEGRTVLAAYVVSDAYLRPDAVVGALAGRLQERLIPSVVVPVTNLERDHQGRVSHPSLTALPVAEDGLQGWQAELQRRGGDRTAAIVAPVREAPRWLHLSQVLPDVSRRSSGSAPAPGDGADHPAEDGATSSDVEGLSPALADGGPLLKDAETPRTLIDALRRSAAASRPDDLVHVLTDSEVVQQSYRDLLDAAGRVASALSAGGVRAGQPVILQLARTQETLVGFWGCLLAGAAPLILAPDGGSAAVERLRGAWELLGRPALLTSAQHRAALETALPCEGAPPSIVTLEEAEQFPHQTEPVHADEDAVALLTLTSGSTGAPKCIPLTHRNLVARALGSIQLCGLSPGEIMLNWLPFEHIGSISDWHLRCVVLGSRGVYAEPEQVLQRPLRWLDLIDRFRVTHSWAPNFAFGLLATATQEEAGRSWDLACIKTLLTAGETVAPETVSTFLRALAPFGLRPNVMQPAFGMAEVGSGVTYARSPGDGIKTHTVSRASLSGRVAYAPAGDLDAVQLADLGPAIPGLQMRIVDDAQRRLPELAVGRLQLRGGPVFAGYLQDDAATSAAFAGDGWFDTGDLGFLAGGHLVLAGRAKDVIVVHGANYPSAEIEAAVEAVPGVRASFAAATAVAPPAGEEGETVAVLFSPESQRDLGDLLREIRGAVTRRIGAAPEYLIPVAPEQVAKTAIGKIRRSEMRATFERGGFAAEMKAADLALHNARTLPDAFHQVVWTPVQPEPGGARRPLRTLLLSGDGRIGIALARALEAEGAAVLTVPADRLPDLDAAWKDLLRSLGAAGRIERMVYVGADSPLSGAAECERVAALIRATADLVGDGAKPQLIAVSNGAQWTNDGERVDAARAALPALIRTAAQEIPDFDARHVDLEAGDPGAVDKLLTELASVARRPEVAWRAGLRLIPSLARIDVDQETGDRALLAAGGTYLMLGGAGGVGGAVSEMLLREFRARLILVGRTSPEQIGEPRGRLQRRLAALRALGDVEYVASDVQSGELAELLGQRLRDRGWALDGVLDLTAHWRPEQLTALRPGDLTAALAPRLAAAGLAERLLAGRPNGLFVAFSSTASRMGGAGMAAYAAAGRTAEAGAHAFAAMPGRRGLSLSWSLWEGLGIGRDVETGGVQARGQLPLTTAQALNAFRVAMDLGRADLLIGLDGRHPNVRARMNVTPQPRSQVYAFSEEGAPAADISRSRVLDRFGAAVPCRFISVPALPRTSDGAVASEELERLALGRGEGQRRRTPPRTEPEQRLAAMWQELLGVSAVSVDESFFELGGHSLMLARLAARIRDGFGVEIPLRDLYDGPTIEAMCRRIVERRALRSDPDRVSMLMARLRNLSPDERRRLLQR